ncbi:MAG: type ISP restriction/modification enzyme [Chloroflexota bacterium]|jgi:hypothetical protein
MPGAGRVGERGYTSEEMEALREGAGALGLSLEQVLNLLGESTLDVYLNQVACWRNVPARVWGYTLGGYQVIKKWLSYRERSYTSNVSVQPQTAVGEPCLQVIDYMNWAVQRAFVKREMRYYRFVEDKVSLLVDRYDVNNYPRNWYHRDNPFDIIKASPL